MKSRSQEYFLVASLVAISLLVSLSVYQVHAATSLVNFMPDI